MRKFLPLIAQTVVVAITVPLAYHLFVRVMQLNLHMAAALVGLTAMVAGLIAALVCFKLNRRK